MVSRPETYTEATVEQLLFEGFLFAVAGLGLEVIETAVLDWRKDRQRRGMGYSSIWYIPFYAVLPLAYFEAFSETLFAFPFYLRGPIYILSFWAVEYPSMGLLRLLLGKSPSEDNYRKSRWSVHGLIRLDLAPVWLCFGFAFEWMFRELRGL